MPKLKIDGVGTVQADDSFLKLSPDDQNAFVAHVADQARQGVKSGGGGPIPSAGAATAPSPRLGMSADVTDPSDVSTLMPGDSKGVPLIQGLAHGANDAVGAVARGIPFADRLSSAMRAITPGSGRFGDYSGAMQDERADAARSAAEHPTGEKVGALVGGGLSAAVMPSFYGNLLSKTAGLLPRAAAMGADGAVQGALQGASSAPDLADVKDVAGRTVKDAGVGFGLGIGAPLAGAGIGAATSFLSKPVTGAGRVATGLLGNLISPETAAKLGTLGPDASLADASPSLLGLAQGVAARPGAGADKLTSFVDARQAGQAGRLASDLDTHLGPAFSPTEIAAQMDAKRTNLLPLLAQADASPPIWNPQVAELTQRPAMQKALRVASDTAANEGRPLPMVSLDEIGREVTPAARQAYEGYAANAGQHVDNAINDLLGSDGALAKGDDLIAARKAAADPLYAQARAATIPDAAMPIDLLKRLKASGAFGDAAKAAAIEGKPIDLGKIDSWDLMKRTLDDKISTAQRAGSNNEARLYTQLKSELTRALDDAVPSYARARQTFASHAALSDALDAGKNAVGTGVSREQVQREFGALGTDGERHLYRLGMSNGLREMVARRPNGPNVVAPLATRQVGDKLATVAPSPEALAQFRQRVADTGHSFTEAQRPDIRGMRYALDQLRQMQSKAGGDQARAIGETAGALETQLGTVPAFARADQGARAADRGQAAFDIGRGVLRQTDTAPTPGDLARAFGKLPLEQQALLRAGARSDIEQRFGQNPNDLSAAKRVIGGDRDFNRGNMQTLFGPQATQAMVDAVTREQAFAATRNAITQGSRTAPMQAGKEMIDTATAPKQPFFPKDTSLLGLLLNAGETVTRKGTEALSQAAGGKAREQLGGLLGLTGPARDLLVRQLLAAQAGRARSAGPSLLPVLPGGALALRGRDR